MTNQCTINWQSVIICQLIVHWLAIVQNKNKKVNSTFVCTALSNKNKLIVLIAQLWGFYFIYPVGLPSFCSMNSWTQRGLNARKPPAYRHKSCPVVQVLM